MTQLSGCHTATDLAGRLPITRQAIAKHLALLAEARFARLAIRGFQTGIRVTAG